MSDTESASAPDAIETLRAALTIKERAFADAFLGEARGNASESARKAGYKDGTGLRVTASRMLTNANVRAYIDAVMNAYAMSGAEVVAELSDIARADWRDFLTIKTGRDGETVSVRMDLRSKVAALDTLAKVHKLTTDRQMSSQVTLIREYPEGI